MSFPCTFPDWITRSHAELDAWDGLVHRVRDAGGQDRHLAAATAFDWLLHGGPAPLGGTTGPATPVGARAELAAALHLAGSGDGPAVGRGFEWGYGAWRALAWLLGERGDAPVQLGEGHHRRQPWTVLPAHARAEIAAAARHRGPRPCTVSNGVSG